MDVAFIRAIGIAVIRVPGIPACGPEMICGLR